MDRYIRDELLDHQDDFTDLPEQGENERASATAALHVVPGRAETSTPLAAGHAYLKSSNPRMTSCARCGRPESAHTQLQTAAVLSALERAAKSVREGNRHYAEQETAFALRLLRGEA